MRIARHVRRLDAWGATLTDPAVNMNAYLLVTGVLFGLITLAHIARMIDEGAGVARDPWYLLLTVAAAALCGWAFRLLRLRRRP